MSIPCALYNIFVWDPLLVLMHKNFYWALGVVLKEFLINLSWIVLIYIINMRVYSIGSAYF